MLDIKNLKALADKEVDYVMVVEKDGTVRRVAAGEVEPAPDDDDDDDGGGASA
jgi:hypothetical protein